MEDFNVGSWEAFGGGCSAIKGLVLQGAYDGSANF